MRRFTRRSRRRRLTVVVALGLVLTLGGLVLLAVFSPLLALRTIVVDGTSRVDPSAVKAALSNELGTPLALIDSRHITSALSTFPLIRSYVTETVPPDTLVIHIVERAPVGQILVGGVYRLVDPAGVTVQESPTRVPAVPLLDIAGADTNSPAFQAIVQVLLALPAALYAQVDSASAHTQDDVSFALSGVGQSVLWGSADDSASKAKLLAALIKVTDPSRPGQFDVSAPSNGIFRPF